MLIERIDRLMEVCARHLEATGSYGTEIENLLTSALVVRVYAEFEQQIDAIIAEKRASIGDLAARAVFRDLARVQGIRFRNLSALFARLGEQYRASWAVRQSQNPQAVTAYGLLLEQRHRTAHLEGTAATFQNVRAWYAAGHIVLDFFRETLMSVDPGRLPG